MPKTSVIIEFKAMTAEARAALARFRKDFKELGGTSRATNKTLGKSVFTLRRLLAVVSLFVGTHKLVSWFKRGISAGVQFNAQMETARLGIAGVLKATDKTGQFDNYNDAVEHAAKVLEQIKEIAPETAGTISGLTRGIQAIIGPAREAGVALEDIPRLTLNISQALAALGVKEQEISQEARALFAGDMNDRQNRLNAILGITKDEIKAAKKTGTVYELITDRLEGFSEAGVAAMGTLEGLKSNLKDAFDVQTGIASENLIHSLKELFATLKDFVESDQFLTMWQDFADITASLVESATALLKTYRELKEVLYDMPFTGLGMVAKVSKKLGGMTAGVGISGELGNPEEQFEQIASQNTQLFEAAASRLRMQAFLAKGVNDELFDDLNRQIIELEVLRNQQRTGQDGQLVDIDPERIKELQKKISKILTPKPLSEQTEQEIEKVSEAYQQFSEKLRNELSLIQESQKGFTEGLIEQERQRLAAVMDKIDELEITEDEKFKLREDAERIHWQKRSEIAQEGVDHQIEISKKALDEERDLLDARLEATSEAFGNIATVAKAFGKKGFAISKAAAVAAATVDAIRTTMAAYRTGTEIGTPVVGAIMAALAGAAQAVYIAQLAAAPPPQFAQGGVVPSGRRLIEVNERGTEGVVNAGGMRNIGASGLQMINDGMVNFANLVGTAPAAMAGKIPGDDGTMSGGASNIHLTVALVGSIEEAQQMGADRILDLFKKNRTDIGIST